MGLALQPALRPWARWQRRVLSLAALVLAVTLLGLVGRPHGDPVQLVVTGSRQHPSYPQVVEGLVRRARERVWVMVFVCYPEDSGQGPVRDLLATLGEAAARGVDVRVVLDLGREWGSDELSPKHERASALLREHGVRVILDEVERTSHPKLVLVDAEHAVIGSHNWTRSAFVMNREISTWHRDRQLVAELEAVFREVPGFERGE